MNESKQVVDEKGNVIDVYADKLVLKETVPESVKETSIMKADLEAEKKSREERILDLERGIAENIEAISEINKKLDYFNE